MKTNRHKAAWAARKAAEARQLAAEIEQLPAGDWRDRQNRRDTLDRLWAEAVKFDQLAARYAQAA
jgi:hypothetical protein